MRLGPALVIFGAGASATLLFAVSPVSRVHADCTATSSSPCPTPLPTPTPVNAFLSLDVTSGPPNTQITVNGGAFLGNESMTLYWDQPNKVAGGANADSSGNFSTQVKPFAGDAPGLHKLCASVPPKPCANFTLQATPSPSPSDSPSPSLDVSPSPTPAATQAASPARVASTPNGFDSLFKPPLVFLPIIGILAILVSLGYWVLTIVRRPTPLNIPATAVVHRATRPDYSAGFATPPATASPDSGPQSAWADVLPVVPPVVGDAESPAAEPGAPAIEPQPTAAKPEPPTPPEANVEAVDWGPPVEGWGQPPAEQFGPDEPLDLPEPGDD